ncbi:MAG: hypothetical protein Q9166_007535, partial [cf. Caloplaca sp. 2 TL-2023]
MKFLSGDWRESLQLDIVGFLAILGESSVLVQSQVAALSWFFLIPRLVPAPQALIRTSRPEQLSPSTGKVVGAYSGGYRNYVNHLAHLLHNGGKLPAYSVRCEKVTKMTKGSSDVKARPFGPITVLSVLGCMMSIALFVLAIARDDGFALVAILALSFLSTFVGIGNRWSLKLKKRVADRPVPPSDVVLNYPNGSFLIIKCNEDTARELYWHPEECEYMVGDRTYRILSLSGTLILMCGVICLGNATLELQIGFAASYIFLNAAYWVVAALPPKWNWDLSIYHVDRIEYEGGEQNPTFTQALWKAIAITQSAHWVDIGSIAPISTGWKEWIREAEENAKSGHGGWDEKNGMVREIPDWDFNGALTRHLYPDPAAYQ